jgi:hypothetical protein
MEGECGQGDYMSLVLYRRPHRSPVDSDYIRRRREELAGAREVLAHVPVEIAKGVLNLCAQRITLSQMLLDAAARGSVRDVVALNSGLCQINDQYIQIENNKRSWLRQAEISAHKEARTIDADVLDAAFDAAKPVG